MSFVSAHEIELYAINTGSLYETHKRLGRAASTTIAMWQDHVRITVMRLYRREIDASAAVSRVEIATAAEALQAYYRRHTAESAQCQIDDEMKAFGGFMRDTAAQRAHVKAYGLDNLDATTRRNLASVIRSDIAKHLDIAEQFLAAGETDNATALACEITMARVLLSLLA